ncbi:RNA-binding cell elongation regulator Jag/EloR [Chloroflexota bacterium]
MDSLEISAKTVEEAIQIALEQLGVGREEVEVTVVKEGKSGILGMGTEEAVVRVQTLKSVPDGDTAELAKNILENMLSLMGVAGSVVLQTQPSDEAETESPAPIALNVKGEDLGILIGRRGQNLSCLQFIVRLIVGQRTSAWVPIVIDVEGYKQRRNQTLKTFAQNVAEQVKARGTSFTLEPMSAYERRIIHLALTDHPDVITQSIGESEARRVVILLKDDSD